MIDLQLPSAGRARRVWPAIAQFPELPPFYRHVAMLLVEDLSLNAIARRLDVTCGTISTVKWRVMVRLEIDGLAGLARLAIRRGYIAP